MASEPVVIHNSTGRRRGMGMKVQAPVRPASRSQAWEAGSFMQRALPDMGTGLRDELLRRRSRKGPLLIGGGEGL